MSIDLDILSAAMEEIASTLILPRFQKLNTDDIEEKSKGDFVTIADREAEQALTPVLQDLAPGSVIVGEEATAAHPSLLDEAKGNGPLWFVDPIDGNPNFATMVAYVEGGIVRQSAIYFPVSGDLFLAERGAGAIVRDQKGVVQKLKISQDFESLSQVRTTFFTRHFPGGWDEPLDRLRAIVSTVDSKYPSACQYTDLARGAKELVIYHRMLPWDHAPGSLILREAGGVSRNWQTGEEYSPSTLQGPHMLAASEELWEAAREVMA